MGTLRSTRRAFCEHRNASATDRFDGQIEPSTLCQPFQEPTLLTASQPATNQYIAYAARWGKMFRGRSSDEVDRNKAATR